MAELGRCNDPSCGENLVRLFSCAHHCTKLVCLHHLIEHDRLLERERQEFELCQNEIKRHAAVYLSLVDEEKLQLEYEQKLHEHQRLVFQINSCFQQSPNDIEQMKSLIEQLKKLIQERNKSISDSPSDYYRMAKFFLIDMFFFY